jgi:isovaleryl-CoA dehydrogenase
MWFFSEDDEILYEAALDFAVRRLKPEASKRDETESLHPLLFTELGAAGFLGVNLPKEYGGLEKGAICTTRMLQALSLYDAGVALSVLAHSVLCAYQIALQGNQEQKNTHLPGLIQGSTIGCMAMSEPNAGSDALNLQTRAKRIGNYFELFGNKTWITNGPIASLVFTYAKTGILKKDISTFLVLSNTAGFEVGQIFSKLGMRSSPTSELVFNHCKVPPEMLVGTLNQAVVPMMQNLDLERITISGISLGLAQQAIHIATQYAKERKAFGKPIGAFQQIQERLANATADFEACQALVYQAAYAWDHPQKISKERLTVLAAAAKLTSAQMATQVCLDCIQILGGNGYTREFTVERLMRDAKLMEIGAGTNEIMRLVIARQILGRNVTDFELQPMISQPNQTSDDLNPFLQELGLNN